MLNEFIQKPSSILIKNSKIDENKKYKFIDKIGDFSKRIPLEIKKNFNYHTITFENIKHNQNETWKIEINSSLNKEYNGVFDNINPLYNIKYITVDGKLILELLPKEIFIKYKISSGKFEITSDFNYSLKLSKLLNSNSQYVTETLDIKTKNNIVDICELISIIKSEKIPNSYWKLSAFIYDEKENEIEIDVDLNNIYVAFENKFKEENITLSNNRLVTSMIETDKKVKLYSIEENDGNLIFNFNDISLNENLIIALRNRQGNIFEYNFYKVFKITEGKVSIEKSLVWDKRIEAEDNLDLLVGSSLENARYIKSFLKEPLMKNYFKLQFDKKGKFYNNGRGTVSIYVKNSVNDFAENVAKIAVLGTCFSRNAFNSSDYFNPDYKKYFNCVYTQFHSTIGSLLSKPAPKSLIDKYQNHNEFKHIQTDMSKTFFSELQESNAEYLIIDLYPDAMLKELTLKNGSKITYSYLIKDMLELEEYVSNWDNHKFTNSKILLKNWIVNLKEFMNKVIEIIPEENIILNKGRLAGHYKKNGYIYIWN